MESNNAGGSEGTDRGIRIFFHESSKIRTGNRTRNVKAFFFGDFTRISSVWPGHLATMAQSTQVYPTFDLAKYFNVKSCAEVPWGHAINARDKLADALKADIMLGALSPMFG